MENTSGIRPTGRTVLVLLDPVAEVSGPIALAQETIDRDRIAQIRATFITGGPASFTDGEHAPIAPGTKVIFKRYAGEYVTGEDGVFYRIMNDKDIYATVDVGRAPSTPVEAPKANQSLVQ